jgi:hypothetical protein
VPGLEVVVIGEEGCVSCGPEEERGDERVAEQEVGAEEEDRDAGQQGEGIEDLADPEAVSEGLGENEEDVGWGEAGIAVCVEEVVEVGKEVGTNDEDVIAEPDCGGERGGGRLRRRKGRRRRYPARAQGSQRIAGRTKMAVVLVRTMRGMSKPRRTGCRE